MNGELDIAVDFTAPESPGRYISYWRLASSTGQKFGQRVWVLIQVKIWSHWKLLLKLFFFETVLLSFARIHINDVFVNIN